MDMRTARILCAVIMLVSTTVVAEERITLGYVTGNEYVKLNDAERMGWLVGAADGIMSEDYFRRKDPKGPWLGRCVRGVPMSQLKAIFEQELTSKPDSWHAPAALVLWQRMDRFCKGRL